MLSSHLVENVFVLGRRGPKGWLRMLLLLLLMAQGVVAVAQRRKVSVAELTTMAQEGDTAAQYSLALCYDRGSGVRRDYALAAQWYAAAAKAGHADAQYSLADCYALGEGVEGLHVGQKVTIEPQVVCGECYPCRHGKYNLCEKLKVMGFQTTGTASEYFTVDAAKVTPLPEEMSLEEGAMIEPLAVTVHAIRQAGDVAGKDICVLIIRYFLCLFCPPLAVLDKGCGAALYVLAFLPFGGIPGIILAFLICARSNNYYRKPAESD